MGGWKTIPGFCSCGFMPRPSSGTNASRSNGFAANNITEMKNVATAQVTAAT